MKRAPIQRGASVAIVAASWLTIGCGGDDTRQLDPQSLALTKGTTAFYDDGELTLYETQLPINLPVRKPTSAEQKTLDAKKVMPFGHEPWVTPSTVRVQLTWTLANLDQDSHAVEVLVDPWSEFGRYVPGVTKNGDKTLPNFSGIQELCDLPGLGDSTRPARIQRTFTYDDMDELATDFATAMNIIKTVKPTMNGTMVDDPRITYVNHTFAKENRSGEDPLTDKYRTTVVPALLGFELGLRTREPVNVVIEFTVEIVDEDGNHVLPDGSSDKPLAAPNITITLGD